MRLCTSSVFQLVVTSFLKLLTIAIKIQYCTKETGHWKKLARNETNQRLWLLLQVFSMVKKSVCKYLEGEEKVKV